MYVEYRVGYRVVDGVRQCACTHSSGVSVTFNGVESGRCVS